jgi:hypothetical protein
MIQLILDEEELKKFVDGLPVDSVGDFGYFIMLFARKKYGAPADYTLNRNCVHQDHIISTIKKQQIPSECYVDSHGNPLPATSLAYYINPVPRSYKTASFRLLSNLAGMLATNPTKVKNPKSLALTALQTSKALNFRINHFDLDLEDKDEIGEIFKFVNPSAVTLIETRGGYHVLISADQVEDQYQKSYYQNISKFKHCDVKGDGLLPIPGTNQGGFCPTVETGTEYCGDFEFLGPPLKVFNPDEKSS